jgi:hypothetical protein
MKEVIGRGIGMPASTVWNIIKRAGEIIKKVNFIGIYGLLTSARTRNKSATMTESELQSETQSP